MAAPQAGCTLKARGAKALREVQMGFAVPGSMSKAETSLV